MTSNVKPKGSSKTFTSVVTELRDFVAQHEIEAFMPTYEELDLAGRSDLANAIRDNGGFLVLFNRLGLDDSLLDRPATYWDDNHGRLKRDWKDFANVERELLAFIGEFGRDGQMPTKEELYEHDRSDLDTGMRHHGGIAIVAARLGLDGRELNKPAGYWSDFKNVEKELRAFVFEHNLEGRMPTVDKLIAERHSSLSYAIAKHGGMAVVAERLGLTRQTSNKKPKGYWNDITNVEAELTTFCSVHHMRGTMPKYQDLINEGRGDLARAIGRHGGVATVAAQVGLQQHSANRKPIGYWDDLTNLERELRAFIAEFGTEGVMPTQHELIEAGRKDLARAISRYGGTPLVANQLRLQRLSRFGKIINYWDQFANLERELFEFTLKHGTSGVMPITSELESAGRSDLARAIAKHGGISVVARRLGIEISSKSSIYWEDFSNFENELRIFIAEYGIHGVMPTEHELIRASWLMKRAIERHGGRSEVAKRVGLKLT